MDIEQQIRILAARGEGKAEVMRTLGISRYKMDLLCSAMPDIKWPAQGHALGNVRAMASQKGYFPPGRQMAIKKAQDTALDNRRKYEICGVRGTITELYNLWRDEISVGRQRISTRLAEGMSLYDAFFLPRQKSIIEAPPGVRKQMYIDRCAGR